MTVLVLALLIIVLLPVLLALAVGPLEALGWWRDEGADEARTTIARLRAAHAKAGEQPPYQHYVVYLSGIGAIDGTSIPFEEPPLLEALEQRLPGFAVISDVFPYSVSNRGLTAQRALSGLWRWAEKFRRDNPNALPGLIVNLRNAIQLFVCADRRYGPTYNTGTAQEIMKSLLAHGYKVGSGVPVTLIGWSGGAQIAVGACWFLGMAEVPLNVISLGGMISDDPGLDRIDKLTHLRGTKDPLERLGWVLFAGRWPTSVTSHWARGVKEGRIDVVTLGPMHHNVKEHYFDADAVAPDGRSYRDVTVDAIVATLTGGEIEPIPT